MEFSLDYPNLKIQALLKTIFLRLRISEREFCREMYEFFTNKNVLNAFFLIMDTLQQYTILSKKLQLNRIETFQISDERDILIAKLKSMIDGPLGGHEGSKYREGYEAYWMKSLEKCNWFYLCYLFHASSNRRSYSWI